MDVMTHQQAEREVQRVQASREELVERIARAIQDDGTVQPLPGLHLNRASVPLRPVHGVLEPALAVIAQGSKEVLLGESRYRRVGYNDASHFSREYKSLFGVPPMRDVQRLREGAKESTVA